MRLPYSLLHRLLSLLTGLPTRFRSLPQGKRLLIYIELLALLTAPMAYYYVYTNQAVWAALWGSYFGFNMRSVMHQYEFMARQAKYARRPPLPTIPTDWAPATILPPFPNPNYDDGGRSTNPAQTSE